MHEFSSCLSAAGLAFCVHVCGRCVCALMATIVEWTELGHQGLRGIFPSSSAMLPFSVGIWLHLRSLFLFAMRQEGTNELGAWRSNFCSFAPYFSLILHKF